MEVRIRSMGKRDLEWDRVFWAISPAIILVTADTMGMRFIP